MFRLVVPAVIYVAVGAVIVAVLAAVTGVHTVKVPGGTEGVFSALLLVAYGVMGWSIFALIGRVMGRSPLDRLGPGAPGASLPRDDIRTLRWLRLLGTELRVIANRRRRAIADSTGQDPGPRFPTRMADHVDRVRQAYEAGDHLEADRLQKELAAWVARIGQRSDDDDTIDPEEAAAAPADRRALQRIWKRLWTLAGEPGAADAFLAEHAAGATWTDEEIAEVSGDT